MVSAFGVIRLLGGINLANDHDKAYASSPLMSMM